MLNQVIKINSSILIITISGKGKAIPSQAWTDPEVPGS